MPKFVVERNWIECIGSLWMPATTAAKRIDLSSYDLENILACAEKLHGKSEFTREAVEHWLSLNEGDFRGVEDFAAYITGAPDMPWRDEESECTYNDCMFPRYYLGS